MRIILTGPSGSFRSIEIVTFPSIRGGTAQLSTTGTGIASTVSLRGLGDLVSKSGRATILFARGDRGPITVSFEASRPFALHDLRVFPTHRPVRAGTHLLMGRGKNCQVLSRFGVSHFGTGLGINFSPCTPIIVSIPRAATDRFQLRLTGATSNVKLKRIRFLSLPTIRHCPRGALTGVFRAPLPC